MHNIQRLDNIQQTGSEHVRALHVARGDDGEEKRKDAGCNAGLMCYRRKVLVLESRSSLEELYMRSAS